jgi:hypothetical protein
MMTINMFYADAVASLSDGRPFYIVDDNLDSLAFHGEPAWVTKAEIEVKAQELMDNVPLTKVLEERKQAYPTLAEQADMQYWDALNGTTTWQDAITAVKAEFPKTTGA